jgi:hypothetical protein
LWARSTRAPEGSDVRKRASLLGTALSVLALLAGCSTVPERSAPRVVPASPVQNTKASAEKPPTGLTGGQFIRRFFEASANSSNNHAKARNYLTHKAAKAWKDHTSTTIIGDDPRIAPAKSGSEQPDVSVWNVSGRVRGRLRGGSYAPAAGSFSFAIRLRRVGKDGWRIIEPPAGVWFTQETFLSRYRSRPVYFLDQSTGRLVADRRWVTRGAPVHEAKQLMSYLLGGPSRALKDAVRTATPAGTTLASPVTKTSSGGLEVNLSSVESLGRARKKQLAAQIVSTLEPSAGPITVLSDGKPLVAGKPDWNRSDLSAIAGSSHNGEDEQALVAAAGKVTTLENGRPVAVPESSTPCDLRAASESLDGAEFGLVCGVPGGVRLLAGAKDGSAVPAGDVVASLSRPTWQVAGNSGNVGYALWTVAGGKKLLRVTGNGSHWTTEKIDATKLRGRRQSIQAFRLSRNGVRFAAIVGGALEIGAVHHKPGGAPSIVDVYSVAAPGLTNLVGVSWADSTHVVVAGENPDSGRPPVVAKVSVDGSTVHHYKTQNLTGGVEQVAASQDKPVLVADSTFVWRSSSSQEPFRSVGGYYRSPVPFYPG